MNLVGSIMCYNDWYVTCILLMLFEIQPFSSTELKTKNEAGTIFNRGEFPLPLEDIAQKGLESNEFILQYLNKNYIRLGEGMHTQWNTFFKNLFFSSKWRDRDETFDVLKSMVDLRNIEVQSKIVRIPSIDENVFRVQFKLHGALIDNFERIVLFKEGNIQAIRFSGSTLTQSKKYIQDFNTFKVIESDFALSFDKILEMIPYLNPLFHTSLSFLNENEINTNNGEKRYLRVWLIVKGELIPCYKARLLFTEKGGYSTHIENLKDVWINANSGKIMKMSKTVAFSEEYNQAVVFKRVSKNDPELVEITSLNDNSNISGRLLSGKYFNTHNCCWRFECIEGIQSCTNDIKKSRCIEPKPQENFEEFLGRTWGYEVIFALDSGFFLNCNESDNISKHYSGIKKGRNLYFRGPTCSLMSSAISKIDGWKSYKPESLDNSETFKNFDSFSEVQTYYSLNDFFSHVRSILGNPYFCLNSSGMSCESDGEPVVGADGYSENPLDVMVNLKLLNLDFDQLLSSLDNATDYGFSESNPILFGQDSNFFKNQFPNAFYFPPLSKEFMNTSQQFLNGYYFLRFDGFLAFGGFPIDGGYVDLAQNPDVILHELQHAVTHELASSAFSGSYVLDSFGIYNHKGTLNEAYSDYLALSYLNKDIIGSGIAFSRTLSGNNKCPDNLAYEIHEDSTVFSSALWKVREVLSGMLEDNSISSFDALVLKEIAMSISEDTLGTTAQRLIDSLDLSSNIEGILGNLSSRGLKETFMIQIKQIFSHHGIYNENGFGSIGYANFTECPRVVNLNVGLSDSLLGPKKYRNIGICPSYISLSEIAPFHYQYQFKTLFESLNIIFFAYQINPDKIGYILSEGCPVSFKESVSGRPRASVCKGGVRSGPEVDYASPEMLSHIELEGFNGNIALTNLKSDFDYFLAIILIESNRNTCYSVKEMKEIRGCSDIALFYIQEMQTTYNLCSDASLSNPQNRICHEKFCPCTCKSGFFGVNCTLCSPCKNGESCDVVSGSCGSSCMDYGAYGDYNCNQTCLNDDGKLCSGKGYCDAGQGGMGCICDSGLNGPFCSSGFSIYKSISLVILLLKNGVYAAALLVLFVRCF